MGSHDARVGTSFFAFLCGTGTLGTLREALQESSGFDALAAQIDFMFDEVWRSASNSLVLDPSAVVGDEHGRRWAVRWLLWCELHGNTPPSPRKRTMLDALQSLPTLFSAKPFEPFVSEVDLADGIDRVGTTVSARLHDSPLRAWAHIDSAAGLRDER